MRYERSTLAALLAAALVMSACDSSPADTDPITGSFAARVGSTEAFVAVVTDGGEVRAYVCDGMPDRAATVSEWFKGPQSGNAIDLPSMAGTARLVATIGNDVVSGRIERTGQATLSFEAPLTSEPSGFYLFKKLVDGQLYWAGWIVLPSGEMRGSMAEPTRTSIGVQLDAGAGTATLPGAGTVRPGRMNTTNLRAGMCGPPLCGGFP